MRRATYSILDYLSVRTLKRYGFNENYKISHSLNSCDTSEMCIEDENGNETGYYLSSKAKRFDNRCNSKRIISSEKSNNGKL